MAQEGQPEHLRTFRNSGENSPQQMFPFPFTLYSDVGGTIHKRGLSPQQGQMRTFADSGNEIAKVHLIPDNSSTCHSKT